MMRLLSVFAVFLFTPVCFWAQPNLGALERYIEQARQDWDVPGMAVALIQDGELVMAKGFGTLEAGGETPVDEHSLFAIASNTKAYISAAIGILVEEGKLNWDDPVRKYLPYFELYDDFASNHTTIRDLLCHRSGLGTFSGDAIWYKSEDSAEEVIRRIKYIPQAYDFRAGYGYSNVMFITAGEVISMVSGKSWEDFIRERIFQPLEMNRTRTRISQLETMANVATPHKPVNGENVPIERALWDNSGAAGGIWSSVHDMAQWLQLQLRGGVLDADNQVFSPQTQEVWWTPHNNYLVNARAREDYPDRNFSGYGLGWGLFDWKGEKVASHSGGYDGMYSRVFVVPEKGLGMVVLTNTMKGIGTALMYHVLDIALGDGQTSKDWSAAGLEAYRSSQQRHETRIANYLAGRKTGTRPSLAIRDYTGTFHDPIYGNITVRYADGQLRMDFERAPALSAELRHWQHDVFQIIWDETHAWFDFGTVQFTLDNRLQVAGLAFDVPNYDIFFDEIKAVKR